MPATIYLITPPFTQLNTPYPATAYLKGFLNTKGIDSFQADLGIEVTLSLFCQSGLTKLFNNVRPIDTEWSDNALTIYKLREKYIGLIDAIVAFLQGKQPTMAHLIAGRNYLPEASRFQQLEDLDWAFGQMGIQDKAKHFATLFLEDLSDFIQEIVDPFFGFSRYAERLGRHSPDFDPLAEALQQPYTLVDELLVERLSIGLAAVQPALVCISVPFPGNLYGAFRCAQWIKQHYPDTKVAMGGGFPNTELRSLNDERVFDYFDFITLDDGEKPLEQLLAFIQNECSVNDLKRTFLLQDGKVTYATSPSCKDYKQADVGTPDYTDLWLDRYISVIEVLNPMHSLWSDGRWNKLTMAHGCYWGKCTFCDISLDYIRLYEPVAAAMLVDRMEALISQTGNNGFHFVDEAAPPALMRALAIEILKRGLVVSWWTNIRFEKSFTRDLCLLLKASGCIGVSGGLEVASDRLLALIQKGITVEQVTKVNQHFTAAGILVHAYLMYGFPTQTDQETVDALEMVRQMFEAGVLQSGYWHLFTMTAHSPVGLAPEQFQVKRINDNHSRFANNDVEHIDLKGAKHEKYGLGLKKSLYNFMHGVGLAFPLQQWFDFKIPKTTIPPDTIKQYLNQTLFQSLPNNAKIVFNGLLPEAEVIVKQKKGQQFEQFSLRFYTGQQHLSIKLSVAQGEWLLDQLSISHIQQPKLQTIGEWRKSFEAAGFDDFDLFMQNKPMNQLHKAGLWIL